MNTFYIRQSRRHSISSALRNCRSSRLLKLSMIAQRPTVKHSTIIAYKWSRPQMLFIASRFSSWLDHCNDTPFNSSHLVHISKSHPIIAFPTTSSVPPSSLMLPDQTHCLRRKTSKVAWLAKAIFLTTALLVSLFPC